MHSDIIINEINNINHKHKMRIGGCNVRTTQES